MAAIEINRINILWAIGALATIILSTAGAVWAIRIDRLEQLKHENETLKDSKNWKLPETLESLKELSQKINLQLEEREQLNSLKNDKESLVKINDNLQSELTSMKERASQLEAEFRKSIAAAQLIELPRGEAADLIMNSVAVGVEAVYSDSAEININNNHHRMKVGNTVEFPYANQICVLQLKAIKLGAAGDKCKFSFGCREK